MSLDTWLIYLLAAVGLSLSPGPNGLLALTHGALHGHRRTLWTVAGGALGFVAVIALSMLGIGALLQTSASALRRPCSAPWVSASRPFGPGESERPTAASR